MTHPPITAKRMFLNMAERLEALETYDYAALRGTGLGEALTHDEMVALVDNPRDVAHLAAHCREQAERERP